MYTPPGQYIELGFGTWDRSNIGYDWDESKELSDGVIWSNDVDPPFLVEKTETSNYIEYDPLSLPNLFLYFAELNPDDINDILMFANKYGTLVLNKKINRSIPQTLKIGEPLEFWQSQITDMKNLVNLWEWHNNRDIEKLNNVISWGLPQSEYSNTVWYSFGIEEPQPIHVDTSALKYGDILFPALHLMAQIINEKLLDNEACRVTPMVFALTSGKLIQRFVPHTLLGAMWFQAYQAVSGEKKFKRCSICQKWEDVTEKKATWTRHPECAGRERVRKYREKKEKKND